MEDNTERKTKNGPAQRLLEVAERLFYQQGFAATGVDELIKKADVARSSFYRHFPAKEDLIVAYLEQRHKSLLSMLTAEVEKRRSPVQRVLAIFDCLADAQKGSSFRGCAFMNSIAEFRDAGSAPRRVVTNSKTEMRALVSRLCEEAGHPDAADEVFMLVEGATAASTALCELWPITSARKLARSRLQ